MVRQTQWMIKVGRKVRRDSSSRRWKSAGFPGNGKEAVGAVDSRRTGQDEEPRALVTFPASCTGLCLMFEELSGTFL